MNKVIISGEVLDLSDVEVHGKPLTAMTVEVKEKYKDRQGEIKSWSTRCKCTFDMTLHGTVEKKDIVVAEGRLSVRTIESDKGRVYITEIRCDQVTKLPSTSPVKLDPASAPF